jgi:hypothetical protein
MGTSKRYPSREPPRQPPPLKPNDVTWHPILAAVELEPGHWQMIAQYGAVYGEVQIVKRGSEVGYRATTPNELVGYFRTLRAACAAVHARFVRSHGAPDGRATRNRSANAAWTSATIESPA